ncbi:MAG: hypothetical protein Q7S23_00275 [bacterium]|nr:hypothetical protein [bacterium]
MEIKTFLKFMGLAVLAVVAIWVTSAINEHLPLYTGIGIAFAVLVVYGSKIQSLAAGPVSLIGLGLVWVAAFVVIQAMIGSLFGISIGQAYLKLRERNPLTAFLDPAFMGGVFFKQLISMVLAGLLAWWFLRSARKGRTALLTLTTIACSGYLMFSTFVASHDDFQLWMASQRGKLGKLLQRDANSSDLDNLFGRATSLSLPKIVVPRDGIPLWPDTTGLHPPRLTKANEVYMVNMEDLKKHPDIPQVFYVWAVKDDDKLTTTGYFRLDQVAEFIDPVVRKEALGRITVKATPPMAPNPAPRRKRPAVPAAEPVVVITPTLLLQATIDSVLATAQPVPTKIIPQQHDRVIMKIGGYDDARRIQFSWGGRVWDDVQPEFVDGQWGAIILFDLGQNLRNQPLLVRVKTGNPVPVTVVKQ